MTPPLPGPPPVAGDEVSLHEFHASAPAQPPLIAHVIYSLAVGGLENGVVNLINHIPQDRFRHAVICLADYSDFSLRIRRDDVRIFALDKPAGKNFGVHVRLWRLLRRLRPDIVHTRNLAALESLLPAVLAGVPARVHSEHGWDMCNLDGGNRRHRLLRRLFRPLAQRYIALSRHLEAYLREQVAVPPERIAQIYNGVDTALFRPAGAERPPLPCPGFDGPGRFVVGTVGRMQAVKDQLTLVRAFIQLVQTVPDARRVLRLAVVGDGPLRQEAQALLGQAGALDLAWLPGDRDDIPALMRGFDLFVLPSLAEGISNTILEAMASGLPVVATDVGGNPELVESGRTGLLVPPGDPNRMADAIRAYLGDRGVGALHGCEARRVVERRFSMEAMVAGYMEVYERALRG
ncbi:MAG: TIGR03088 family PEP-CTERM/XrtA system glycosyltransferase [Sulfuricella sp.]|nr:TIGR03088 family PEP-CTERM/XrtA system glycosyltransferase [Sulfuricella sp.]